MLATAPSIIGAPFDAGRHRKPPNLSAALTANCLQMWCWSWAQMLTHSAPMSRIVRRLVDVRAGQNEIYGGSSDTDVTVWQVKPHFRVPSLAVMTAIPVQNRPRTLRMDVGVGAQLVIGLLASFSTKVFAAAMFLRNRMSRPVVTGLEPVTCVVSL